MKNRYKLTITYLALIGFGGNKLKLTRLWWLFYIFIPKVTILQDFVELPPDDMQKLLVSNTVSIINIKISRWLSEVSGAFSCVGTLLTCCLMFRTRIWSLRWVCWAPTRTSTRRRWTVAAWPRTSTWRWPTRTSSSARGAATPATRTATRRWSRRCPCWSWTPPPWCCWAWWASSTSASRPSPHTSQHHPASPATSASSHCCFKGNWITTIRQPVKKCGKFHTKVLQIKTSFKIKSNNT